MGGWGKKRSEKERKRKEKRKNKRQEKRKEKRQERRTENKTQKKRNRTSDTSAHVSGIDGAHHEFRFWLRFCNQTPLETYDFNIEILRYRNLENQIWLRF